MPRLGETGCGHTDQAWGLVSLKPGVAESCHSQGTQLVFLLGKTCKAEPTAPWNPAQG